MICMNAPVSYQAVIYQWMLLAKLAASELCREMLCPPALYVLHEPSLLGILANSQVCRKRYNTTEFHVHMSYKP